MDTARTQNILRQLLAFLGFEVTDIAMQPEDGGMTRITIVAPQPSRIIGWHGETLNAVQHLLKSCVRTQEKLDRSPFLVLDIDGYRLMQEDKVRRIAEQKADFVRRTGNRIALAPMSPYFRRVVHLHVANTPALCDLTTESVGEGEYRQIVLQLKNQEPGSGELSPVMEGEDGLANLDV